jgi:phosphatidylserine/phosphatidylglycerophosphate/cardiolipin synthase-like enzyme
MLKIGGIEMHMGPTVLGAPDDLDAVIQSFIAGAKSTLDVAVQEIDSEAIAQKIIEAKQRGVRVRVILEGDYLTEDTAQADPWAILQPGDNNEANRRILNAFLRARIDVVSDLNAAIFHQKFIVRDLGKPTAATLTGSTNFTLTDTGKNTDGRGNNLNHLVILHGASAANQYAGEFERLRSGTFGELHERVEPRPREFTLGGMRVKPLFAPRHGPEMEVMKQMLKATKSIDFAMFTFSKSSGIDDTMLRLAQAQPKIRIRGVLDRTQGAQGWAPTQQLKAAGVELYANKTGTGVRKLHHKLMVIDEELVIAGSFNYTEPATVFNDENIVVIGDTEVSDPGVMGNQQSLADYALTEIERIIADLGKPV